MSLTAARYHEEPLDSKTSRGALVFVLDNDGPQRSVGWPGVAVLIA